MKKALIGFLAFIFLVNDLVTGAAPALAATQLVKGPSGSAVYFVDSQGVRHPFPNELTYQSWYGRDFSRVVKVNADQLARYPLGKNITIRPGTWLVKVATSPTVYAVELGGVVRPVTHGSILESWYGTGWSKRVATIPEVFFDDYTLGAPIVDDFDLPSGVVIKRPQTNAYFWHVKNVLREFTSVDAVRANGFAPTDAIITVKNLHNRTRSINGYEASIVNPVAVAWRDTSDCESAKLKVAMLIITNGNLPAGQAEKVEEIKQKIPETYAWASDNFSSVDVTYPTVILKDDGQLIAPNDDGSYEVRNEAINSFYADHPDQFDFIFVWTGFRVPTETNGEIARFIPVTNRQTGTNHSILRAGEIYGSAGKLKGIVLMGEIAKYHPETLQGMNQALTYVLHELLHQWSGSIQFSVDANTTSDALLRQPDERHWSYYAGFISPLGGSGWVDNRNGTFTSQLSSLPDGSLRPFSRLDLYLMGLIPPQLMEPVFYVEPSQPGVTGNTIAGVKKTVTINQILEGNGKITCVP